MKSTLFIVNPASQNAHVKKIWHIIEKKIKTNFSDYTVKFTKERGHATVLAMDEKNNFDQIIAVGGDGTMNEILQGLYGSNTTLGTIPVGNGNDYANSLGLTTNIDECIAEINKENIYEVPVGVAESTTKRYFLNIAEMGITSLVARDVLYKYKWLKGQPKYYLSGLLNIFTFKSSETQIIIDNNEPITTNLVMCAVGLGCSFGGGFEVLPNNSPLNSDFGICYAGNIAKIRMFNLINKLKKGKHLGAKGVHFCRGRKIELKLKHAYPFEAEGEMINEEAYYASITLAEHKQPFVVPQAFINKVDG